MKKTTNCKYCGKKAIGFPAAELSSAYRNAKKASRFAGTIANVLAGNYVLAWNVATGKCDEVMEKAGTDIIGGILYHFTCTECRQSFDKMVL